MVGRKRSIRYVQAAEYRDFTRLIQLYRCSFKSTRNTPPPTSQRPTLKILEVGDSYIQLTYSQRLGYLDEHVVYSLGPVLGSWWGLSTTSRFGRSRFQPYMI